MKNRSGRFFILFIAIVGFIAGPRVNLLAQQDPQFSQYMFNIFGFNPAYAGSQEGLDLSAGFRSQWAGLAGSPQSQFLSGHLPLYKISSGIGLQVLNDLAGEERTTSAYVAYSYMLPLDGKGRNTLSFGLQAGVIQKSLDGDKLRAPQGNYEGIIDHNDDFIPVNTVSGLSPDIGVGLYFIGESLEAGFAVNHLINPTITYELPEGNSDFEFRRHLYANIAYRFTLGESFALKPGILYKSDLVENMVDFNAILFYQNNFWGGVSFRSYVRNQTDAVVAMLGAHISRSFSIGYSYDFTLSELQTVSSGSHEVVIKYNIYMKKPRTGKQINNLRYLYY